MAFASCDSAADEHLDRVPFARLHVGGEIDQPTRSRPAGCYIERYIDRYIERRCRDGRPRPRHHWVFGSLSEADYPPPT